MHSRLNDEQTEQFFERLNKPLKRMPQDVRAELHTELRQHLDALIAANKELGSLGAFAGSLGRSGKSRLSLADFKMRR